MYCSPGSGAFFQVCQAEGATCSSCAPVGSRESVKCQVRQEACAPRWNSQLRGDKSSIIATENMNATDITMQHDNLSFSSVFPHMIGA